MDDIVKDFLIESNENLDRLDQELVQLESEPQSRPLLDAIFRTIHTIKGSCGFLGFIHLEKVTHAGESLLSKLREGELCPNAEITSALLAMVDAVRTMLGEIQTTESDGENDYPELQARLKALRASETPPKPVLSQPSSAPPPMAAVGIPARESPAETASAQNSSAGQDPPAKAAPGAESPAAAPPPRSRPAPGMIGALLVDRGSITPQDLAVALQQQEGGDPRRLGEILVGLGFCAQEDVNAVQQILETRAHRSGVETVRVGVDLLDTLMNLVGELVLARNQLLQLSSSLQDVALQAVSQRMNLIVTGVQEQIMKTRLQPIGIIWNKFPRTVRDLALSCGKEVELGMQGEDTELDRTIIEAIKDPLTHLVRNAIDHGIEMPEARRQACKETAGKVTLRAFHEGGRVNIEILDDGAGLNAERLIRKAIEKGFVTEQQAKGMSELDAFNLILLPGFSTAEKVTNVSGRGVGMDVVKTNVEKIGGTISIHSTPGKGTSVRVSIPLTLAIVPALIVRCRNERFAIPQVSVLELVGLDGGSCPAIELVYGTSVYRLRGKLLPLLYLDRELQIATPSTGSATMGSIVVLQANGRQFGLVVDDILDTEEIVVKPLAEQFKSIAAYSGATIMGDGRIALILDVLGLAERARVISEAKAPVRESSPLATSQTPETRQELLLARNCSGQVAIPLSGVARLERFPADRVKRLGDREAMEYRGQVIPVIRLSHVVPPDVPVVDHLPSGSMEVIVHSENGEIVALVVDCILEIVERRRPVDSLSSRPGVLGSFINDHNITELLDIPSIIRAAIPHFPDCSERFSHR